MGSNGPGDNGVDTWPWGRYIRDDSSDTGVGAGLGRLGIRCFLELLNVSPSSSG